MKNAFVQTFMDVVGAVRKSSLMQLTVLLCAAVFCLGGCTEQPGEVAAKGHRRHLRNLSINNQNMMSDLDRALLIDKPSRLTDKRIPPDIGN